MSWLPTPRPFDLRTPLEEAAAAKPRRVMLPMATLLSLFRASARGQYRIFNPTSYRFYWSSSGPPVAGGTPQATNSTLPFTTTATFANGTWYLSASYFDGVLDSGFLPIGPQGQTYLQMVISGGALVPTPPSSPMRASLQALAGGVVQINAYYNATADSTNSATLWAIAYTTNGSTPASGSPSITPAMSGGGALEILTYQLPAQANGTMVKVQLQTARALGGGLFSYSPAAPVMTLTAIATGPGSPLNPSGEGE